jgi:hypothetical protein
MLPQELDDRLKEKLNEYFCKDYLYNVYHFWTENNKTFLVIGSGYGNDKIIHCIKLTEYSDRILLEASDVIY